MPRGKKKVVSVRRFIAWLFNLDQQQPTSFGRHYVDCPDKEFCQDFKQCIFMCDNPEREFSNGNKEPMGL